MVDTLSAIANNSNRANNTQNQSAEDRALTSLAGNFDNFLTILTSQLKNQDPLDPLDSSEFTNQLVLFAGVEQDIALNNKMQNVVELLDNGDMDEAVQYIGKQIEARGNSIHRTQDTGSHTLKYELPEDATTVTTNIYDSAGRLIRTLNTSDSRGLNQVDWDGKNGQGVDVDAGSYQYRVTARNADGETIDNITTRTIGNVTAVRNNPDNNTVALEIGDDITVSLEDVLHVTT